LDSQSSRAIPFFRPLGTGWTRFLDEGVLRPNELVLLTVAPYWCYMMMWRMVMYSFFDAAGPSGPSLAVHYVADLLLFPVLLVFCRLALAISISRRRLWWLVPMHLGLGIAFALLREPAFRLAAHWIDNEPPLSQWWSELEADPHLYLNLWAGYAVQYAVIYTTALGLLGALVLYGRWRTAVQQRLQLESLSMQSKLKALRMQLNPHFLFNALNLVSSLVDSEPSNAKRMVARLGNFLRRVLDEREREQIRLGEELDFVEDYLAIQEARFGERVDCSIQVEEAARQGLVPPLLLQPLIENALKHGMDAAGGSVRIELTATADGDWLEITIANETPATPTTPAGLGIGLSNLRERIATLYGEFGQIEVENLPSGRYVARLRIPFETMAVG
jgi:Histidine kinase